MLPLVAGLLLSMQAPVPAQAWIVKTAEGNRLKIGEKEWPVAGDRILWSPGARRLAIYREGGPLETVYLSSGTLRKIADQVRSPRWAPDGARLLFVTERGLEVYNASIPSDPSRLVAEGVSAGAAAWSPDSDRIAFADRDHLWVTDSYGEGKHRVLRGRSATTLSWSPDGRWLAFVQPGFGRPTGDLFLVRSSGTGLRKLGPSRASFLEYSPNGRWLLIREEGDWKALEVSNGRGRAIPSSSAIPPIWVGGAKLLFPRSGEAVAWRLDRSGDPEALWPRSAPDQAISWAAEPYLEVTADLAGAGFPRAAMRPGRGRMALQGAIVEAEPIEGKFVFQVEAYVDGAGREVRLARPVDQPIVLRDDSQNTGARVPLRTADLRLDSHAVLIVRGARLDPRQDLSVDSGWLEEDSVAPIGPLRPAPRLRGLPLDYDGVSRESVVVPMVFPVVGKNWWQDWFLRPRGGGTRRHHGQDIMAAKMTPMVACFDGVVSVGRSRRGGHNTLTIRGDNGWIANYYHINNDTPGTDDGRGTDQYAFAPGLESGQRVFAGQFVAYVGDSGNSESTAPHLHFELWDSVTRGVVNAAPSLRAAEKIGTPLARRLAPDMKLLAGEVRYDGIVETIDRAKGVVRAQLLSRTVKGKTVAVTQAQSLYARIGPKTDLHFLGNENLPLSMPDLRAGLYMAVVGPAPAKSAAIVPRRAAFAPAE